MDKKEFQVQKALGLAHKYKINCIIGLTIAQVVSVPISITIEALNEKEATDRAFDFYNRLSPKSRKRFVEKHLEEELLYEYFREEQSGGESYLIDNVLSVPIEGYKDPALDITSTDET
jgi:hypothetical protein